MNSKYRDFIQRQQMGSLSNGGGSGDDSMRQLFGDSPDNQKLTPTQPPQKKNRNVEDIPIPTKEGMIKKGYIAFGIILLIEAIFLLTLPKASVFGFLGGTIMAGLSFILARKVNYKYTRDSNYFFQHFTITLKGVLNHYRTTFILLEASEKIFIYSIGAMAVQHFLLFWLPLSTILYSIGYYGMLLGIILNLAKRKTELIYKGLFLYSILLVLMTIQNAFGGLHYVNYHTVVSLIIFWYLAGFFQSLKITDVQIDTSREDLEVDVNEQGEDDLL